MRSSVPAFKAALLARLVADDDLTGEAISLSIGNPHPARPTRELVVIGDTTDRQVEYRGSMSQARETYAVQVLASVVAPAVYSHAELLTRAYDIAEAITTSVLGWRLDGYGGTADIVTEGAGTDDEALDGDVRESSVTLSFRVTASI